MDVGFEDGTVKGLATLVYDISLSACDLRLLRLRLKKNRARRSEMRTNPPITPPMIAPVGFL